MKLTNENYFSPEASMEYFGVSQMKTFMDCEARALAECKGEWKQPMSTALLVGSYVDAYFEGTLEEFKLLHPEIFTQKGTLRADYKKADEIIERLHRDKLFMEYMSGQKQVIMTGDIAGYPMKIKIDSYHPRDKIVDLKVMRSLDRIMGVSLVTHWKYDLQAAVYQHIEAQTSGKEKLPFYLAIATKEEITNLEIVKVEQSDMDDWISKITKQLPRWQSIKNGEIKPECCGVCPYCVSKKVLTEPISSDLVGFSKKELEKGYFYG